MLVENRDYAVRKASEDRMETNKKESGIIQVKPMDMNAEKLAH